MCVQSSLKTSHMSSFSSHFSISTYYRSLTCHKTLMICFMLVWQFLNQSVSPEHSDSDSVPMSSPGDTKPLIDHIRPQKDNDMYVQLSLNCFVMQICCKEQFTKQLSLSGLGLPTFDVQFSSHRRSHQLHSGPLWPCRTQSTEHSKCW